MAAEARPAGRTQAALRSAAAVAAAAAALAEVL